MSASGQPQDSPLRPTKGAMLPFTDLSVDVALGVDGIVLPQARHGGLLRCSPFGQIRSHNVSTGSQKRQEDVRLVRVVELTRTCDC
ncbi:hypothetical protein CN164_11295 [Sinorhizobium meliloti]|nr:hypothetical protein CN164_11295 [Sinorhizobium meliloti]